MAKIFIIDDDRMICETLADFARSLGDEADHALTLQEGLAALSAGEHDLVFLDVNLPDGNGLAAIPVIRQKPGAPVVIIITGEGIRDGAAQAISGGAWDYIEKPLSLSPIRLSMGRALQYHREKVTGKSPKMLRRASIIGNSPAINRCLDQVADAAHGEATVLITGETGTGKELFARAIHENSERADANFVIVDCAALPATLVESVLFGHEKGAFTGADRACEGLIRQAHQGTLFLDEVGELSLEIQKKFLRVLQEHRFRPVGGVAERESRFRLVAATNRNLDEMVREGTFREDLLFRLRVFQIVLPPLRERREDIPDLLIARLSKLCKDRQLPIKGVCSGFLETINAYDWPGNVRELMNVVESAFAAVQAEPTLFAMHLPVGIRLAARRQQTEPEADLSRIPAHEPFLATVFPTFDPANFPGLQYVRERVIDQAEHRYLAELLRHTAGNTKQAIEISGLSRAQFYRLLRKHRLSTD